MPLLALWVGQLPAGTFGVYGPEAFVRTDSEQPDVFSATFPVFNPDTTYTLKIYNGGIKGSGDTGTQSSSTELTLNGEVIELPDDFKRKKNSFYTRPVTLRGSNELGIMLGGKPRSVVTLEIDGVDNDPPLITATVDVPANPAGRNNSDVTVSFSGTDTLSGIVSVTAPVVVATEAAGQVITGTATDAAGNSSLASVSLNIDKTPPRVTPAMSPPANTAGWNDADVTISFAIDNAEGQVTDILFGSHAGVSGVARIAALKGRAESICPGIG